MGVEQTATDQGRPDQRKGLAQAAPGGAFLGSALRRSRPPSGSACAGGAQEAGPEPGLAQPQQTAIWVPFGDKQFDFESSWKDFLVRHPGWTREIVYEASNAKFVTAVTAGDAPDVFMQPSMFLLDAAARGLIRPLDRLIAATRWTGSSTTRRGRSARSTSASITACRTTWTSTRCTPTSGCCARAASIPRRSRPPGRNCWPATSAWPGRARRQAGRAWASSRCTGSAPSPSTTSRPTGRLC